MPTISLPATRRSKDPAANATSEPNAKRLSSKKNLRKPRSRCRYVTENLPIKPDSTTVNARNGNDRRSTIRTSGKRYSSTANQFPKVTTTGRADANTSFDVTTASASADAANVAPVVRPTNRSGAVQPNTHV